MSNIITRLKESAGFVSLSGATYEQIERAENSLGLKFSDEYREYLTAFGVASAAGHEFTGICASSRLNVVDVTELERQQNIVPNDWYVVEQANIDGIVIWQASTGEVYQTIPNGLPIKLCDSLSEYLDM